MQLFLVVALSLVLGAVGVPGDPQPRLAPLSDELIDYINNHPSSTWKAGRTNRFKTIEEAKMLLGGLMEPHELKHSRRSTQRHNISQSRNRRIPIDFDSRTEWSECKNIADIWDQSACGSCWAFGAVSAMSDRMCIIAQQHVKLSARDLVSCCRVTCGYGCSGGWAGPAWDYWRDNGLVTGGSKEDGTGCLPYPFPAHTHGKKHDPFPTPECLNHCQDKYQIPYLQDKIFGAVSYNLPEDMEQIQLEIMHYGPVEACFNVYEDFLNYESGVYSHQYGELAGGHCVRIIGWGVDGAYPYWLMANSWNTNWGEKGLFRMLRGYNECGIEGNVVAGRPFIP